MQLHGLLCCLDRGQKVTFSAILYVTILSRVSAYNYKSTIEASIPSNGHLCLGDCLKHDDGVQMCTDSYSGHETSCLNESRPTFRYSTLDGIECSSNCGTFQDTSYEWCVTEHKGSVGWGYCTRRVATTAIETLLVDDYLTCTSECAERPNERGSWCDTAKGRKSCTSSQHVFLVKEFTKDFKLCSGPCEAYGGSPHCYDEDGSWERCYRNPDVSGVLTKFNQYIRDRCPFGEYTEKGYQLCRDRLNKRQWQEWVWPVDGMVVLSIANTFEGYCPSVAVNEPSNPIYSYSIRPMPGDRYLPLVIRARITSSHLRGPGERETITAAVRNHVSGLDQVTGEPGVNDECGHLLASVLGGPTEYYNFIPQSRIYNRGFASRWYYMERDIYNFLHGHPNRRVEWVAVVSYNFDDPHRPHRPTDIGLSVRMYEGDGLTSGNSLDNMWFTNRHHEHGTVCRIEDSDEDDPEDNILMLGLL